jgi:3-oxoacyl-(acyl-carrier-protein) synthase
MLDAQENDEIALIPHVYDGDFDPELAAIPLATKGMRRPIGPLMSNSFGFGGNNCCLILERGPA